MPTKKFKYLLLAKGLRKGSAYNFKIYLRTLFRIRLSKLPWTWTTAAYPAYPVPYPTHHAFQTEQVTATTQVTP